MVGTPEQIADQIELLFRSGAADRFNLMPPLLPESLDEFVDHVIPVLQQRGLFRHSYATDTLRGHLGLERPETGIYRPRGPSDVERRRGREA